MTEPRARRRILVVDDNQDSAQSLAKLLQLQGHDVSTAHDGLDAMESARTLRPDVILLDVGLPILDGHGVAKRIRAEPWGKNILLIASTGWGREDDRRRSLEAGFDHHLVKPVDLPELIKLVASHPLSNTDGQSRSTAE